MNKFDRPTSRRAIARFPFTGLLVAFAWMLSVPTASAQLLDAIDTKINTALTRLQTLQTGLNNTFAQARDAAQQTAGLQEVVTRIREVYDTADGPAKQFIDDYLQMVIVMIQQQRDGYSDFITPDPASGITPAAEFRSELNALLAKIESLVQEVVASNGNISIEVKLSVISRLTDALPDSFLYPFHVMLSRELKIFDSGIADKIDELRDSLAGAREILALSETGAVTASMSASTLYPNSTALATTDQIRNARLVGNGLKILGNTVAMVGRLIGAFADVSEEEGKLGIHGYIAAHVTFKPDKMLGDIVEIAGDVSAKLGERVLDWASDQEAAAKHQELIDGLTGLSGDHVNLAATQQDILAGQIQIIETLQRIDPGLFPAVAITPPAPILQASSGPSRVHVDAGDPVVLNAPPVASPDATYQWRRNGAPIDGAVFSTFTIRSATGADTGAYDVVVTDASGTTTSAAANIELIAGRVLNVSVRFDIPDNGLLIAGFVLESAKDVVIRGIGESLASLGVPLEQTMPDPQITLFDRDGQIVATNDDYVPTPEGDAAMQAVGAFPIVSTADAALIASLPAGPYTVHISGKNLQGGDCLVEVYDAQ